MMLPVVRLRKTGAPIGMLCAEAYHDPSLSLLLPQEVAAMTDAVSKMHAFYAHTPNAPLYQREFGFYVMDRWIREGHVLPESATPDRAAYLRTLFSYDDPAVITLTGCGGCGSRPLPAL